MTKKHTFSIDAILRRTKYDPAKGSVYMRVTVDGHHVEISTKEMMVFSRWSSSTETITGRSIAVQASNEHLDNIRFKIREHYRQLMYDGISVTAQLIKDAYLGIQLKPNGHTLGELIEFHKKIQEPKLKKGTVKNYAATEAYIRNFLISKFKTSDRYLFEIDYEFIVEFEHYIPNNPLKRHDPCEGNGIAKHIERLKKMISWAKTLSWMTSNPFDGFVATRNKAKRKKLLLHELVAIEKLDLFHPSVVYIRDLFIFSCYTGLAYADVMALKSEHIECEKGIAILLIHRQKSEELSAVPLFETAQKIIDKYATDPRAVKAGRIFPPVSNQEVNRCIKIFAAAAGIQKPVTFHSARHTFATTVTLKSGVPIESVSAMLGHKKITTTQIYAQVDEEKLREDMHGVEAKVWARKKSLENN